MFKKILKPVALLGLVGLSFYAAGALAADAPAGIGGIVTSVTGTISSIGKLMIAVAYLAGFGLTIGAIFKFKQHKDNPQQVQLGTCITMLVVGLALIFLPNIIAPAGTSIFGGGAKVGGTASTEFGSGFGAAGGGSQSTPTGDSG